MTPAAWVQLLALSMIWGASFLTNKLALGSWPPFWVTAFRVGFAVPVLWLAVRASGQRLPNRREWPALMLLGLTNNVMPFTLITWGQEHVPSGLAAILNSATALFSMLLAGIFLADERLTGPRLLGIGAGFSGVVVVIGPSVLRALDLQSLGQLAVLGATLCYAVSALIARKTLGMLPPLTAAAGMLTWAALYAVPMAWGLEGAPAAPTLTSGLAVAYSSMVATAVAYLLMFRVLAIAGAGNVSMTTLLVAPIAVVIGALVLGESLALRTWPGFGLIALGLVIIDGRVVKLLATRRRPG